MHVRLFALLAWLTALPAGAVTLTGTVVAPDGQPVSGATVWIYRQQYQPQRLHTLVATLRTAADGSFSCDDPHDQTQASAQWEIYAHAPGFPILPHHVYPPDKPIALKLASPATRRVTIAQPGGKPIPGVQIVPLAFSPVAQSRLSPLWVPREVAQVAAVTTDAAGEVGLLMPARTARVMLEASAKGYGILDVTLDVTPTVVRLALQPAGSLTGTLVAPDGSPIANAEIKLQLESVSQGSSQLKAAQQVVTDAQGRFAAAELPPGAWNVALAKQPTPKYHVRGQRLTIKPGEQIVLDLKAEPTVLVHGRILDHSTGRPAADVTLSFQYTGGSIIAKTDADGRVAFRCLPGRGTLQVMWTERVTHTGQWQNLDVPAAGLELTGITVQLARQLQVVVADEQGNVPKYTRVVARQMRGQPWAESSETGCDDKGLGTLKRLSGGEAIVRATAGDLASEPVTVRIDDQTGPLKLVLKPGLLAVTKVRVLYADGTPYAKQHVSHWMTRTNPQASSGGGGETDANGVRESHGIEPGLACRYSVTASGCPTVSTDEWVAVAGETHDFGELVLRPEQGSIAGGHRG